MNRNQFAIYRVDLNTEGWKIRRHSYQYVRDKNLELCINNYRQIHQGGMQEKETVKDVIKRIHGAASNPTLDSVGTSDVLVLNRNGELILNGNFFYLMENQKYRGDAAAVILDTYGKIIADDVMHGFDEETKQKIRDSLKKPTLEKKPDPEVVQTERMLLWQKYLQNGTWERRSESGTEANYDMVDGRVNNMPEKKPDQQPRSKKKSKKRVSVIRRLHQKQIDIAKRSGKPVPMYLQEAERNRK